MKTASIGQQSDAMNKKATNDTLFSPGRFTASIHLV